jgi:hypothetical protein
LVEQPDIVVEQPDIVVEQPDILSRHPAIPASQRPRSPLARYFASVQRQPLFGLPAGLRPKQNKAPVS